MSLTLAIDCSMRWISLGLADKGRLYAEENINTGPKQSEILASSVESFLARSGFTLADIEQIAVTTGPGYYTGIRVGISYATLLAESLGVSVVPVTTLLTLAWEPLTCGLPVAPMIRARSGAVYAGLYSSPQEEIIPPGFYGTDEFIQALGASECEMERILTVVDTSIDQDEIEALERAGCITIRSTPATGLKLAVAALSMSGIDPALVTATYFREPDYR